MTKEWSETNNCWLEDCICPNCKRLIWAQAWVDGCIWCKHTLVPEEDDFTCTCDWVKKYPGNIEFTCEFCGLYIAAKPRCNKCEQE